MSADAARWFVLSDSPPEKDINWSVWNSGFMENMPENMDFGNDHKEYLSMNVSDNIDLSDNAKT